jgi:hypothetical protein
MDGASSANKSRLCSWIIPYRFESHKVCARWVPEQLAGEHKRNHLKICQALLNRHSSEGDASLRRTVTGVGTWIHYYAPEGIFQSMEWKYPISLIKKFKTQPLAGKVMLTLWGGDSQDPILELCRERHNSKQCSL